MILRPTGPGTFENVLLFDQVDSTQSLARELVAFLDGDEMNLVWTAVAARSQSKGRGRGDRSWSSPAGGLYVTMVVPAPAIEEALHRPLEAAVTLAETLAERFNVDARIKWPNDVLVGGRKIAGLLLELVSRKSAPGGFLLVGLGLNLRASDLDGSDVAEATGLAEATGREVGFVEALDAVLGAYGAALASPAPRPAVLARWLELSASPVGSAIRVRRPDGSHTEGRFAGLDEVGRLRLETAAGTELFASADIVP